MRDEAKTAPDWEEITLRKPKTGEQMCFNQLDEKALAARLRNSEAVKFDMNKLEAEYDYDTDKDAIANSKEFLYKDLYHAVEFFVKDCPLKLVHNIYPAYASPTFGALA